MTTYFIELKPSGTSDFQGPESVRESKWKLYTYIYTLASLKYPSWSFSNPGGVYVYSRRGMLGSICIVVDIHPRRSNWISSSKYLHYVATITSCFLYLSQFIFLEVFIRKYRDFFIVSLSKWIITVLLRNNIIVHIRNIKKVKNNNNNIYRL